MFQMLKYIKTGIEVKAVTPSQASMKMYVSMINCRGKPSNMGYCGGCWSNYPWVPPGLWLLPLCLFFACKVFWKEVTGKANWPVWLITYDLFWLKRYPWNLHAHFGFWHFLSALTQWPYWPQIPQCGWYTWLPYWPLNFHDRTSADIILLGIKFLALLHTANNVIGFSFLKNI